jgi:hypothetical protein
MASGGAFAQANLVQNGGFETGDFTDWTLGASSSFACVGSTVACVGAFGLDNDPGPHSGNYAAYLGGSGGTGGGDDLLSQSITTTAGQGYYLTFYLAAPTFQGQGVPNSFAVEWDGNIVDTLTNLTNTGYDEFTFWVRGSGSDLLGFDSDNLNSAFVLDDVSMTSAPEPAALGLLLVGMTAVGVAARRRRRAA